MSKDGQVETRLILIVEDDEVMLESLAVELTDAGFKVEKAEDGVLVHGDRCLLNAQESGYQYEGRVSVGGKKYRAFTASQMFLHGSQLYNFAILYVVRSKS